MATSIITQFVLKQFAKKSARKTGIAKLLKVSEPTVKANVKHIEKILKNMGVDINKLKSTDDVLKHMNIHKAMMNQHIKKQFGSLDLDKGIKSLEKKKIDVSKYTDDDLNALVREDIDLITEANKLSEAGTNYGRVREIEARRKEIREIIEAAQAVPESGYSNIKADLALHKQKKPIKPDPEDMASGGIARVGMAGGRLAIEALKKLITKKYAGKIDDDLLQKMLVDNDPQRLSEVMATIDEALIMQNKGMKPDAIMDTFKESFSIRLSWFRI